MHTCLLRRRMLHLETENGEREFVLNGLTGSIDNRKRYAYLLHLPPQTPHYPHTKSCALQSDSELPQGSSERREDIVSETNDPKTSIDYV